MRDTNQIQQPRYQVIGILTIRTGAFSLVKLDKATRSGRAMDSQSFEYWMAQGHYIASPHQTTVFDMPPDLSKVPSLSGSPVSPACICYCPPSLTTRKVSSTYDQFPAHIHQAYYPHIVDEPVQFGSYPIPMTPSDFGSDHDSPYCSPRSLTHPEPGFGSIHTPTPTERTHTTSGVS